METTDDFGVTKADWIVYELMHRKPQGFTEKDFLAKAKRVGVTRREMHETLADWTSLGHLERGSSSNGKAQKPTWRRRSRTR